jgi:integrase
MRPANDLTVAAIRRARPGDTLRDRQVPGLTFRAFAGSSAFYLYFRTRAGTERRPKIGDGAILTLDEARVLARRMLAAVAEGRDPKVERLALRDRPTIQTLRDWHIERHAETKNKARTVADVREIYKLHVIPALGARTAVADVGVADIETLHHKMRATPYRANRVAATLHKAFNLAERWGWRPRGTNPVQVERYRETKRRRYPAADEAVRLFVALDAMRDVAPEFVGLIEILLFTGARRNEIQTARRAWVKPDGLHLPDSKTGEKVVRLNSYARAAIERIPVIDGNPYLIPGRLEGTHLVNVRKNWVELCRRAEIVGLRMHDLRRFYASAGLSDAGVSLDGVGQLLGHTQAATTKGYAYLIEDAGRAAAEAVGQAVHRRLTADGKVAILPSRG